MSDKQLSLIPQGTKLLVPKDELQAKLDNVTALYVANLDRLSIALNLLTPEQIEEYKIRIEGR